MTLTYLYLTLGRARNRNMSRSASRSRRKSRSRSKRRSPIVPRLELTEAGHHLPLLPSGWVDKGEVGEVATVATENRWGGSRK